MTVMVETISPPQLGVMEINLQFSANIQIAAEAAKKRVSVLVGNKIADLLYGDTPNLVIRSTGAFWRVPVIFSSRSLGRIGAVGFVDVNAETGEFLLTPETIHEIEDNSQRFAAGAAL